MIMKYLQSIILIFFLGSNIPTMAKDPKPIDFTKFKCTYQFKFISDTLLPTVYQNH